MDEERLERHPALHPSEEYERVFGEMRSLVENRRNADHVQTIDMMYNLGRAEALSAFIVERSHRPGQDDLALYALGTLWELGERERVYELTPSVIDSIRDHKDPDVADVDHRLLQAAEAFQQYIE